ncbi:MAG: protein-L-isoaspartate(D-aspartate) O-methyltransferase [Lentimicrobiaceae bacterium]|nr:protein-L-isoaspartate(D-aspartate) O-methyltransferase [Lentimicrobiaceae bacterium]
MPSSEEGVDLFVIMMDSFRTQGSRKQLVEELKAKGISDCAVLEAIGKVPRHCFVSFSLKEHAYADIALPIACKQTISQPYTVAKQTELLEVKRQHRVLEIGTGSGYQSAVLKQLGAYVYTIERQRNLYENTKKTFQTLSLSIASTYGDGYKGWAEFAPFDRVLITCGCLEVPQELLNQLKVGGILVAPVGDNDLQEMIKIVKKSPAEYSKTTHGAFKFVPMLKNEE